MQGRPEGSKEALCPGPAEQKGPLKFIDARLMNSEYKSQMNKPRQSQNRIRGFSTDSVLKPLILFCDWRGLIKESPR